MNFDDLDPHAYQSLLKQGGKKKLDTLMDMLKANGPQRIQELLATNSVDEAKSIARALKSSAANLGLASLEDSCDQILTQNAWSPKHPLALEAQRRLGLGQAALIKARQTL